MEEDHIEYFRRRSVHLEHLSDPTLFYPSLVRVLENFEMEIIDHTTNLRYEPHIFHRSLHSHPPCVHNSSRYITI